MILKIHYNWYATTESEEYEIAEVGVCDVVRITEHRPKGEGDKWFYHVHLKGSSLLTIFNPNQVFEEEKKE